MACSKIFSGNLPELLNEIIQYFRNDFLTLHSCILVNRLWCRLAIPLLWEDPFSNPTANYHFIRNFLYNLNDNDKTKLIEYEINIDLIPSNTLFNYPNYIKCLNTWKIFHYNEKWIDFIKLGTPLNSDKIKEISKIIYNSILKNENNINLRTFEIILIRDHDYFNDILELILQNQNLILNIKNLKISFNGIIKTTNIFYDFLKFLYNNCKTISILYFHHKMNYDDLLIIKYCSELIISQQNLEKMLFGFHIYNSIFLSLKNSNCSNTLKTIIFYNINFKNITNFKQVIEQLNVLKSIHILYCFSLNYDFIQQIININKPFKLTSLFMKEKFQIDNFQALLQISGDYLENIGLLTSNKLKYQLLEIIIKYCKNIKFFDLPGFDYQNIYLSMDLIKKFNNHHLNYIIIDFDRLHILNQPNDDILNISSIILKELGQILPLKLEYLDLSLSIDENIFEIFLKNSQNTFIKKLLINNKIQIGNENILSFIKEYIMKKKKIDYFAFKMKDDSDDSIEKCKDLFSMKDEIKIFESYNIKVQNYGDLKIQHYSYIEEMY
ncbi:hypothetical protein RhiirC2_792299 [Rhizophagus irregularis]|uniref:F-box domain-containing protein n=1 Tax=Rhizophagus irregularis TaxID=588596 RepID=A0A2N1MHK3_9GLOM|nr:hypothetical protein RhiirC2_792299 [Rhizophagus irregularis]